MFSKSRSAQLSDAFSEGYDTARERASAAAETLGPKIADARDAVGPAVRKARKNLEPKVREARKNLEPKVREARKNLEPKVREARKNLEPKVREARKAAQPYVDRAKPYVETAQDWAEANAERLQPAYESSRDYVRETAAPAVAAAISAALEASAPARAEAGRRGKTAALALKGEVPAKKRRWPVALLFFGLGAAAGTAAGIANRRAGSGTLTQPTPFPRPVTTPASQVPSHTAGQPDDAPSTTTVEAEPEAQSANGNNASTS